MKGSQKALRRLSALLIALVLIAGIAAAEGELTTTVAEIAKYGNLILTVTGNELLGSGFDYGDILTVRLNGQELAMPLCKSYNDVAQGELVCRIVDQEGDWDPVILAVNMGDLATSAGLAVKEKTDAEPGYVWHLQAAGPIEVALGLKEKGGFLAALDNNTLLRKNNREDYPDLTDAEFANFRAVAVTGIAPDRLFRSASPINPDIGRQLFADAAMKEAGIRTVLNTAENRETAEAFPGYAQTWYSTADIAFLDMGVDFTAPDFRAALAAGLRYLIAHEGPYLIHCSEGKDRTGFAVALLGCLMGASPEEITDDYMLSFYNLYGVQPGTTKYEMLREKNINTTLGSAFGAQTLTGLDLPAAAEAYLTGIGLTGEEIAALKARLAQ